MEIKCMSKGLFGGDKKLGNNVKKKANGMNTKYSRTIHWTKHPPNPKQKHEIQPTTEG